MRTLNHPFIGVLKLPYKTCPFSLQVSVYRSVDRSVDRSVNRSVQPPCLRYRSPLHVRSEQIGMKKRSDFIPQSEFLKSEIGIPIERNFPAGYIRTCRLIFWFQPYFLKLYSRSSEIFETLKP